MQNYDITDYAKNIENKEYDLHDGDSFDAVVVGAGHAGCEACLALARTGQKTLIINLVRDNIAFLPCNPSIGGTAKGHIVCEVDAKHPNENPFSKEDGFFVCIIHYSFFIIHYSLKRTDFRMNNEK